MRFRRTTRMLEPITLGARRPWLRTRHDTSEPRLTLQPLERRKEERSGYMTGWNPCKRKETVMMDALKDFAMRNVDPVALPVSAQLVEDIRRIAATPGDPLLDAESLAAHVAVAVLNLETYVSEVKTDVGRLSKAIESLLDRLDA